MSGWMLEVLEGPSAGLRIAVDGPVELGRATREGRLTDEQVSRHHARVEPDGDGVRIIDLHSTNGTYVDGRPIAGPRRLGANDTVRVGITVLRLRRADDLAREQPLPRLRPDLPQAAGMLRPADAEELSAADLEAQEEAIIRAQELQLTVLPAAAPPVAGGPAGLPMRGPLSRIVDAQVAHQARMAAVVLLGSSALSVILYYALR